MKSPQTRYGTSASLSLEQIRRSPGLCHQNGETKWKKERITDRFGELVKEEIRTYLCDYAEWDDWSKDAELVGNKWKRLAKAKEEG